MQILRTILTIIFAIDCIALTVVVLMQEGKQQGLGGTISGASDTYWGRNKGRSMEGGLVRATTIMAVQMQRELKKQRLLRFRRMHKLLSQQMQKELWMIGQ